MLRGAVLALDPGTVRVGLAGSDPGGVLATPLAVLDRSRTDRLWAAVNTAARERGAVGIVVGLPRRLDGTEAAAAADARAFAAEAAERTGLPVELHDERFSTVAAERALLAQGVRRRARRARIDAAAAAVVLQSYLDEARRAVPRP